MISKFEANEKFLKFVWTFQLFVFLDKELGEFAMGTVVVLSFGKISLTMTEPIWWQLFQKEAHSVMRMMGIKIHMFLQLEFGWQLFMTGFYPLEGKNYMNAHPDINILSTVSTNDRVQPIEILQILQSVIWICTFSGNTCTKICT